jgi:hypothetical protein
MNLLRRPEVLSYKGLFSFTKSYGDFSSDAGYENTVELFAIRECLSCGIEFPSGAVSPRGLVIVLGQLLFSLPRPLLPPWLCPLSSLSLAGSGKASASASASAASSGVGDGPEGEDLPPTPVNTHTPQMKSFVRKMLQQLPLLHYNTLVYVISYLRLVLSQSAKNESTLQQLCSFCVGCMTALGPALDASGGGGSTSGDPYYSVLYELFDYMLTVSDV